MMAQQRWAHGAIMCRACMSKFGVGLGTGKGQEYLKNEETGEFEKLRG